MPPLTHLLGGEDLRGGVPHPHARILHLDLDGHILERRKRFATPRGAVHMHKENGDAVADSFDKFEAAPANKRQRSARRSVESRPRRIIFSREGTGGVWDCGG